ncbi:MAG TPA: histidine kinase [Candidatus Solibacter sp.]|nr:histidine kinase [Candidatus Solibacter sp.]
MPKLRWEKSRQVARAYLLSIAVWCGLSLLTAWQYHIFDLQLHISSTLWDMILLAEARGFSFALLTPPIFYLVCRNLAAGKHTVWHVTMYAAGVVPFLLLFGSIRWLLLPPWDSQLQKYVPRTMHSPFDLIISGFADQVTMYIAVVVAAHAYAYFERVRKQEMERYEYQQALAASELQALKMQLHPHFLFNTLHGIATLIDTDGKSAKNMVIKLSSLLRTTLQHSGFDLIPLREELKFASEYLALEKMRFGVRLSVDWSIEPQTQEILVPQLILQPLVENAIRHGIACSREKSFVEVSSRTEDKILELRVRNNIGSARPEGTGVGLRNTEARLRHLYSDEASLSFSVSEDQTATVTVRFPSLGSSQTAAAELHAMEPSKAASDLPSNEPRTAETS